MTCQGPQLIVRDTSLGKEAPVVTKTAKKGIFVFLYLGCVMYLSATVERVCNEDIEERDLGTQYSTVITMTISGCPGTTS